MSMKLMDFNADADAVWSLLRRSYEAAEEAQASVARIVADVKVRGDEALFDYARDYDRVDLAAVGLVVAESEIRDAYNKIPDALVEAVRVAKANLEEFHTRQLRQSWFMTTQEGIVLGHRYVPMDRIAAYTPAGTAPLGSSLLMSAVPAQVAGVKELVVATPPSPSGEVSPYILVVAAECGITEIYRVGGPWSIAALAYGTETVRRVDKIVGPGNIYVSLAKKAVYGQVGIDGFYGPSEVVVIADASADAEFIAADLLSQAEHGVTSAAVLITPDIHLARRVISAVESQLTQLTRGEIACEAIHNCGAVVLTDSLEQAFEVSNECAPEHLEIHVVDAWAWLGHVRNAGAVFLGAESSEPIGDYVAGTNHSLPTNGTARFSSGLGVDDFVKRHSVISYTRKGLEKYGPYAVTLAEQEGLDAHANAIKQRLSR